MPFVDGPQPRSCLPPPPRTTLRACCRRSLTGSRCAARHVRPLYPAKIRLPPHHCRCRCRPGALRAAASVAKSACTLSRFYRNRKVRHTVCMKRFQTLVHAMMDKWSLKRLNSNSSTTPTSHSVARLFITLQNLPLHSLQLNRNFDLSLLLRRRKRSGPRLGARQSTLEAYASCCCCGPVWACARTPRNC